jgi:2-polyprenyl-3-methyl-5-hydroxy-6-metoxy-1,4-benzoquinol methylase
MNFSYTVGETTFDNVDDWKSSLLPSYDEFSKLPSRQKKLLEWLRAYEKSNIRILDYGAGIGAFGWWISRKLDSVKVVNYDQDFTSNLIGKECFTRENCIHTLDSESLSSSEKFEVVMALELIEHIPDLAIFLTEIKDYMHEDGMLIISTPNAFGFQSIKEEFFRRVNSVIRRRNNNGYVSMINSVPYDPVTHLGHLNLFSPRTLFTLLKSQGFEVVKFMNIPQSNSILHRFFPETLAVMARRISVE